MRLLVWLTVTLRFMKSPVPDRVFAEPGGALSAEAGGALERTVSTAAPSIIARSAATTRRALMFAVLRGCAWFALPAVARLSAQAAGQRRASPAPSGAGCQRRRPTPARR